MNLDSHKQKGKKMKTTLTEPIYNHQALVGSAFLGGPLAFAYMSYANYKVFSALADEKEKSEITKKLFLSFVPLATVLLLVFMAPTRIAVLVTVPLIVGIGSLWKETTDSYVKNGGKVYGNGKILLTMLLSALVWVASVIGVVYVADKDFRKDFGLSSISQLVIPGNFDAEKYNSLIDEYTKNEEAASAINEKNTQVATTRLQELEETETLWAKNASIITSLHNLQDKPKSREEAIQALDTYTSLRVKENSALKTFVKDPSKANEIYLDNVQADLQKAYEAVVSLSKK